MSKARVAIVMGSDSDWATMQRCDQQLRRLGLQTHVQIMSAHRNPDGVSQFARSARSNGIEVIIAGAGMAAALAGTIAAHTTLPVIGVPVASGPLQGIDALLSTVQMPPGVPVATVGIGAAGAANAAILAAQIIARSDPSVAGGLEEHRAYLARNVAVTNRALQDRLGGADRGPVQVADQDAGLPKADQAGNRPGDQDASRGAPAEAAPEASPRSGRLKGAMTTVVGHSVPEMGAPGGDETADMEELADLASRMSESDHQAVQELLKRLKAQRGK